MKQQPKPDALSEFSKRVAYAVTELNGLISSVVNQEVTVSDFDSDLTGLFDRLRQLEAAVNDLAELFWR